MSKSSLLCVQRGLLRVAPVVLVMLGLFAARPASAGPIVASVFACGAGSCFQGGATGTLTGVFPSGAELYISRFAVPIGAGETESFYADIIFSDGTVSGDVAIFVNYSTSPFGPVFSEDTLSLTAGTFSFAAGKITANLSGTGYFCDVVCELTGGLGQTGSASLSVNASPTPEPSTYLLWGTAGLLGLGIWARRRFRATEGPGWNREDV